MFCNNRYSNNARFLKLIVVTKHPKTIFVALFLIFMYSVYLGVVKSCENAPRVFFGCFVTTIIPKIKDCFGKCVETNHPKDLCHSFAFVWHLQLTISDNKARGFTDVAEGFLSVRGFAVFLCIAGCCVHLFHEEPRLASLFVITSHINRPWPCE